MSGEVRRYIHCYIIDPKNVISLIHRREKEEKYGS